MKYLKQFETEQEYNSYVESDSLILPNVSFITESSTGGIKFNPLPPSDPTNGYEYVDLGLPSGLKWAKCNIGAEKESDYGLYFQWGDVVGYSSSQVGNGEGKKYFSWSDYKYCNRSSNTLTKYNTDSSYGIVDNLTTIEPSDDSASVNMGGSWRMPSEEEYQELINNTTGAWTTINGVNGGLFTSKTNNNTLFFPATGYCSDGRWQSRGVGHCWSSSLDYSNDPSYAYFLYLSELDLGYSSSPYTEVNVRHCGLPIRGVIA